MRGKGGERQEKALIKGKRKKVSKRGREKASIRIGDRRGGRQVARGGKKRGGEREGNTDNKEGKQGEWVTVGKGKGGQVTKGKRKGR